jgi:hypothetical protein
MSQYYKLNEQADLDDIRMINSLVGMEVLEPFEYGGELSDAVLTEAAVETWIFRQRTAGGSTLKVAKGETVGVAECPHLPYGYYHIIKADR